MKRQPRTLYSYSTSSAAGPRQGGKVARTSVSAPKAFIIFVLLGLAWIGSQSPAPSAPASVASSVRLRGGSGDGGDRREQQRSDGRLGSRGATGGDKHGSLGRGEGWVGGDLHSDVFVEKPRIDETGQNSKASRPAAKPPPLPPPPPTTTTSREASKDYNNDFNKNKDKNKRMLLFTMDSIVQYGTSASKGGPAGEIIIRKALTSTLLNLNPSLTIDVAKSDEEMLTFGASGSYDAYVFDPWTWAGPGWKVKASEE